jgi:hypothetical protein
MNADTSVLLTALSVGNKMRVYRHALDPRYNDYVLVVNNPLLLPLFDEDLDHDMMSPFSRLFREHSEKRQGESFCGVLDDKSLERQEFSLYARLFYEKLLEDDAQLTKIWREGKSWTRVPAKDLGLHVLDISENED